MQEIRSQVEIRIAAPVDAPELARLNAAFNGLYEAPEALARRMGDPRQVEVALLALLDDRTVGFAGLRLIPSLFACTMYAELTELFVEPSARRHGVGRALVQHAERLAREAGAESMYLLAGLSNTAGQAFYHALGYRPGQVAMCRELDRAQEGS